MPETGGAGPDDAAASWVVNDPGSNAELGFRFAAGSFNTDDDVDWPDVLLAAPGASSVYVWNSAGIW